MCCPLPYEFGLNTAATSPFQIIGQDKPGGTSAAGNCAANPCSVRNPRNGIDNNVGFSPNGVRNRYNPAGSQACRRPELEL